MIRINKLDKYFNKGKSNEIHVINDVSLDLPDRGMVAVFGKSGCGKTTLLNVIGGLDGFSGGSVEIDGAAIGGDTDSIRNRYIGYIFQNYNLCREQTCYENVADALKLCGMTDADEIDRRVVAALKNVGMDKYAKRPPDTLSGGQQQRIAIARAIVKNPRIILADEPTGNLDEANTLVIMELLKEISKAHLVVLVTHEAHLVDYYCDRVIELGDGKVLSVRDNEAANGYVARDKNDIYLGELEKSELGDGNVRVEYYGDAPKAPVKLKIVNSGGKLYLRVDTADVHTLDDSGEIRLREGVFKHSEAAAAAKSIDMSELPPVQNAGKCGRLFSFRAAAKTGLKTHFVKKRSRIFFRRLMTLFAAVFVLVSAFFGTAFRDMISANKSYNHNAFYVLADGYENSMILSAAVDSGDSGIDYTAISGRYMPTGVDVIRLDPGYFETFSMYRMGGDYAQNAVTVGASQCVGKTLSGKTTELADDEAVISSTLADRFLDGSALGYIRKYDDLLGLRITSYTSPFKIVGIVDCDEPVVYLTDIADAERRLESLGTTVRRAAPLGLDVGDGETMYVSPRREDYYPDLVSGDTVKMFGHDFSITAKYCDFYGVYDYAGWLESMTIKRMATDDYMRERMATDGTAADGYDAYYAARYYEYLDYYYEFFDEYAEIFGLFGVGDEAYEAWLYSRKNIEAAYDVLTDTDGYCYARKYKAEHGEYPSYAAETDAAQAASAEAEARLYSVYSEYRAEYAELKNRVPLDIGMYYVSDADYIAMSKSAGASHGSVWADTERLYMFVHSSDPKLTAAYLGERFSANSIITPDAIRDELVPDKKEDIVSNITTLIVLVILLSLCMYFIMRSSLMSRIKEIGIYRAIGVSKKNLIFKFFVETLLLTTLTVFIGYLIVSVVMGILGASAVMSYVLFYPIWFALIVLVVLYGVCLLCGLLPILTLLTKSPSAILSKYDI